ncbi:hypothetical protein BH11BAC1_BH11BAC1_10770 [soil metagenome]
MKSSFKFLLLMLMPSFIMAQDDPTWGFVNRQQADSLRLLVLNTPNDTLKMSAYRFLGFYYQEVKQDSSLYFHEQQLALAKKLNIKLWQADACSQMGYVLDGLSNYPKSFESFSEGIKIAEDPKNESSNWQVSKFSNAENFHNARLGILAMLHHDMGNLYGDVGEPEKQKSSYLEAIKIGESIHNGKILSLSYASVANFYSPDSAIILYNKALYYSNVCGYKKYDGNILGSMAGVYYQKHNLDLTKKYWLEALQTDQLQKNLRHLIFSCNWLTFIYNEQKNRDSSFYYANKALETAQLTLSSDDFLGAYSVLAYVYKFSNNIDSAYKFAELAAVLNDSLKNVKIKNLTEYQKLAIKDQLRLQELENEKVLTTARTRSYALLSGLGVFLLIGVLLYRNNRQKQKANKYLAEKNEIITEEKKRSDELLLNILPSEVAEELKSTGAAKAKAFTLVTVMFTDFKDFTNVSEKVSAELLVDEIHHCFSAFDNIIQKYKIEKIKTIGDAYLCASGLPVSNYTHAVDMLNAAFEIRNFMLERKKEKEAKGEIPFELKIGIHTGPVVAGIVGVKKYAYDIWGDTVNLAARMEQNSDAGKINISGSTYELVKTKFKCEPRGKIDAKNKGMIDMYFVNAV